jgi:flagellar motor switch protein FliM
LQILHESFARLFGSTISGYLRTTVHVDLASIEQISYEEYTRSISASLINILDVKPLSGQALYEVDLRILFVMIDRLLGGRGEGGLKSTRDLTEIERVLAENIVTRALKDLESAWDNVQKLKFESVSIDTTAQFLQIVPNNDTVLLVLFEVRIGERQGAMSVCMPYQLMKPILAKLNAQRWFQSGKKKSLANLAPQVAERLRQTTRVNCIARLGVATVTMGEIAALEPGQIIPLTLPAMDGEADSPEAGLNRAEVLVGNSPKFRGRIGLREGRRLAIQIEEVLPGPQTLISHKETN